MQYIQKMGSPTLREIGAFIAKKGFAKVDLRDEDIYCIIQTLVFDGRVDQVRVRDIIFVWEDQLCKTSHICVDGGVNSCVCAPRIACVRVYLCCCLLYITSIYSPPVLMGLQWHNMWYIHSTNRD